MFTPDRAANCAVEVQDVTDETISIVGDIMYAVCQLNSSVDPSLTMSPVYAITASIEVNYDGVSDTIITAAAQGGDSIESVIVVPRRRASHKTTRSTLAGMSRRTRRDRGD
jgi:hypothetical protein